MKDIFVADFETTTKEEDCRVWGWGLYDITNDDFKSGDTIENFFSMLFDLPSDSTIYFHNLKFDGEFLFYYLFKNGFTHTTEKKLKEMEFSTLISYMGVFYAIKINYDGKEYSIYDSLKIIPLPVKSISKAFGIEQLKGDIDYTKERPIGYKITDDEIAYIKNDVEIVGKALLFFFNQNLSKMTQASNAFFDFKNVIGKKKFEKLFPQCINDKEIRQSYRGGFTYVNPKFQNKEIGQGIVLDVNSLYPSVMYNCNLPYGEPIYYEGEYKTDKIYNIYVQMFRCNFELKKGFLPTLQLKNNIGFSPTEYVTDSNGLDVTLCMTSVDMELFFKHYDVYNVEWFGGWKFKSTNTIFKDYIDKWVKIKEESTINKNEGMRTLSKLMLNALYGKFGLNPIVKGKTPTFDGEMIHYVMGENEEREPIYIPVASFVTAYARKITIDSAQLNIERFIYADTDSLHLIGTEEPTNINIDNVKLGYWKREGVFTRARFLRAKSYIEEMNGQLHIACAGLPSKCHEKITFDNFRNGLVVGGKLQHKRVKGGVVLKEIDFTIKM
jgi:hypothetical protein